MQKMLIIFIGFYLISSEVSANWITALEKAIAKKAISKAAVVEKNVAESEALINLKKSKPILDDSTKANISFQTSRIISKCKLSTKNQTDPMFCDKKKEVIENCISEKIGLNLTIEKAVKDCETNLIF
jgi:hypothetical protein